MQYRNYNPAGVTVISVDEAGNLLRDEPVKFDYNRELAFRIPVQDATGKPVGESTLGESTLGESTLGESTRGAAIN